MERNTLRKHFGEYLSVSVEERFEGINSICISYILRKIIQSSNGRWKERVKENIDTGSDTSYVSCKDWYR